MPQVARQLTVNVQVSNVWKQLLEGSGGPVYSVPSSGSVTTPRGDIKMLRAINDTSGSAIVDIAISSGSVITDDKIPVRNRYLGPNLGDSTTDDSVHVARAGEGVWGRAIVSSGSPNVTFRASLLELI